MSSSSASHPSIAFDALAATALVGTARTAALPAIGAPIADLLARLTPGTPEERLLDAAAALGTYELAGRRARRATSPPSDPCPPDDLPSCGPRAAQHLARILADPDPLSSLLGEWSHAAVRAGRRAPDECLPALLRYVSRLHPAWGYVSTILGARGRWLARRHPEWRHRLEVESSDPRVVWETGKWYERSIALRRMRETSPALARECIAATWKKETADERAKFVARLAVGLGPEDEPFLEAALDDRSKDVRHAAADLLASLSESAYARRQRERALPLLRWTPAKRGLVRSKKASLEVTLPEEPDASGVRDGLDRPIVKELGRRATALAHLLAAVDPDEWTRACGAEPGEIIDAALENDHADALLFGWSTTVGNQRTPAWAEALWARLERLSPLSRFPLLRSTASWIPASVYESAALRMLSAHPRQGNDAQVGNVLFARSGTWSVALSRAVLADLRAWVAGASGPASFPKGCAYRLAPDLADEAARGWPEAAPGAKAPYADAIDAMISTLRFRRDFLEELRT
jgi:uncharacterized protein DUF5691